MYIITEHPPIESKALASDATLCGGLEVVGLGRGPEATYIATALIVVAMLFYISFFYKK
jgi:hypothetical protein